MLFVHGNDKLCLHRRGFSLICVWWLLFYFVYAFFKLAMDWRQYWVSFLVSIPLAAALGLLDEQLHSCSWVLGALD